jgi:hypothetical protein
MKSKIFISSTCFDLIDLRAELEHELNEMGLDPILSDSLTSGFEPCTDANSIETCLVNLRQCDYMLLILSQRYGPSLAQAGFDDISATHLEYKTALAEGIPIFVYVRDKLEAELAIFQKHKDDLKALKWVNQKDLKIFGLLEEHKSLKNTNANNWYWTFRNSMELKQRVRLDLKQVSGKSIIKSLIASGQSPLITIEIIQTIFGGNNKYTLKLNIRNVGTTVAFQPLLQFYNLSSDDIEDRSHEDLIEQSLGNTLLTTIESGCSLEKDINIEIQADRLDSNNKMEIPIEIDYTTMNGHRISDVTSIIIESSINHLKIVKLYPIYKFKRFINSDIWRIKSN